MADTGTRLPSLVREIRRLTGWSQRDLADVLRTSHTTVRKLETDGRVTARSRSVAARIAPLHDVLLRLSHSTAGPGALALALTTARPDDGIRPVDLLAAADWANAFTAALDIINGPRPRMLVPAPGTRLRDATREL